MQVVWVFSQASFWAILLSGKFCFIAGLKWFAKARVCIFCWTIKLLSLTWYAFVTVSTRYKKKVWLLLLHQSRRKLGPGWAFDVPLKVFPTLKSTAYRYLFSAYCTGTYKEIFFLVLNWWKRPLHCLLFLLSGCIFERSRILSLNFSLTHFGWPF